MSKGETWKPAIIELVGRSTSGKSLAVAAFSSYRIPALRGRTKSGRHIIRTPEVAGVPRPEAGPTILSSDDIMIDVLYSSDARDALTQAFPQLGSECSKEMFTSELQEIIAADPDAISYILAVARPYMKVNIDERLSQYDPRNPHDFVVIERTAFRPLFKGQTELYQPKLVIATIQPNARDERRRMDRRFKDAPQGFTDAILKSQMTNKELIDSANGYIYNRERSSRYPASGDDYFKGLALQTLRKVVVPRYNREMFSARHGVNYGVSTRIDNIQSV